MQLPAAALSLLNLSDSLIDPILIFNSDLTMLRANKPAIEIFAIAPQSSLDISIRDLKLENEQFIFLTQLENTPLDKLCNYPITQGRFILEMKKFDFPEYQAIYLLLIRLANMEIKNHCNFNQNKSFWDKQVKEITGENNFSGKSPEEYMKYIRNYYDRILASAPCNVYRTTRDLKMLGCNDNTLKTMRMKSLDEFVGLTYAEVGQIAGWTEGQALSFENDDREVIRTGISKLNVEEPPLYDDAGNPVYFLSSRRPLYDDDGKILGVIGVSVDITDKKKSEGELAYQNEVIKQQANLFKHLSATVAHELRTPLLSIEMGIEGIKVYLPEMINAYQIAKEQHVAVPFISPRVITLLNEITVSIKNEVTTANLFIDMLLANIREEKFSTETHIISNILTTIQEALARYPLLDEQRELIHVKTQTDFNYKGPSELLIHVLFNLLKNALYYIKKVSKGEIQIWAELKNNVNELHFKDTGAGIAPEVLPHIFERFFSNTYHGTGVGLTYCKMVMESFGGDIRCHSIQGEYTEFILTFPKTD